MLSKVRKPRCPNGTRRNKKTNNCDKKNEIKLSRKKSSTLSKSNKRIKSNSSRKMSSNSNQQQQCTTVTKSQVFNARKLIKKDLESYKKLMQNVTKEQKKESKQIYEKYHDEWLNDLQNHQDLHINAIISFVKNNQTQFIPNHIRFAQLKHLENILHVFGRYYDDKYIIAIVCNMSSNLEHLPIESPTI